MRFLAPPGSTQNSGEIFADLQCKFTAACLLAVVPGREEGISRSGSFTPTFTRKRQREL